VWDAAVLLILELLCLFLGAQVRRLTAAPDSAGFLLLPGLARFLGLRTRRFA
jgi:hypothetical protein